tara:strand:+ start:315 stop:608 length:294 start_codon:yes stop_codon:yes gene_type:complete
MGENNNGNKIGFQNLDNFLKVAPIIGIGIIAYFQSLFPSKADFDKMTQSMFQIEKEIIEIKTLQNSVDINTKAIQDIQKQLQTLEIQIVRMQQPKNN